MKLEIGLEKLHKVTQKVIKDHPTIGDSLLYSPSKELERLVKRIVNCKVDHLKQMILALTYKETNMIAGYIPHNYFKVELENLCSVFKYRSSVELCQTMYEQWQYSYDNDECNSFFEELAKKNDDCKTMIKNNNMDAVFFEKIMTNEMPPILFGRKVLNENVGSATLVDKLKKYGVRSDSLLYRDCEFMYYTYCSRYDYCSANVEFLKKIITDYIADDLNKNRNVFRAFLCNFLDKLNQDELIERKELVPLCKTQTGDVNEPKYHMFFASVQPKIIDKYRFWLNQWMIFHIFPDDARGRFWSQYDCSRIIDHRWKNKSFLMEFKDYFVIEFTEADLGAVSVFTKENFEYRIRGLFNSYDDKDLKSVLYRKKDDPNYVTERMIHLPNPGWEYNMSSKLWKYGIRPYEK